MLVTVGINSIIS